MTRLKLIINLFFIMLALPLAYFVLLSHWSVQQDERTELQDAAKSLFDNIERDLNALVFREETRAVDEYSYYLAADAVLPDNMSRRSPLSYPPQEAYILGYLQNNPDGSLQTPLVQTLDDVPLDRQAVIKQLQAVNTAINTSPFPVLAEAPAAESAQAQESAQTLDNRSPYASKIQSAARRGPSQDAPMQRMTKEQLYNVMQQELPEVENQEAADAFEVEHVQVKVMPMQAHLLNEREILIFRHIEINSQPYRQGFVILIDEFLHNLRDTYFSGQPLAEFTQLRLEALSPDRALHALDSGEIPVRPAAAFHRVFPRPFAFVRASLFCEQFQPSGGRRLLNVMRALTGALIIIGLLTMYQSARTVMELSERRAQFVSSVTHELKTPLTNIRMYSEMLEDGMAPSREREQEYFRVINSESRRLSRLIEQVLEFSRLERKQRRFQLQEGDFTDVLGEVRQIAQHEIERDGFVLTVENAADLRFRYDREVMVQILLNLIGNSLKFGRQAAERAITVAVRAEAGGIRIAVADTGPGIPEKALKKVFDDFYRGDHAVSQTTRGTGIGLALVKKYVTALGGSVRASNNAGAGCTISLWLPD